MLQGTVERVTYHDPDSFYSVLRLSPESRRSGDEAGAGGASGGPRAGGILGGLFGERTTAVGRIEEPAAGLRVRLHGRWAHHAEHGLQFEFVGSETLPPVDPAGIVRFLASKRFHGIGKKLATRIVERLGAGALARIREDPSCLEGIPGLKAGVRAELAETLAAELGSQELTAFLLGVGLHAAQAAEVRKKLGPDAERKVRADPYLISGAVRGVGFQTADRVAGSLGVEPASPVRLRAILLHVLERAAADGHARLPVEALLRGAAELARGADGGALEEALGELRSRRDAVVEEAEPAPEPEADVSPESASLPDTGDAGTAPAPPPRHAYLASLHHCESRLARNIAELLAAGPARPLFGPERLERAARASGIALHASQRSALVALASARVALLTGGPGVGKTTIVRLLVELAREAGLRIALASPTGRAAKRLAEATGHEASTVHRLLGYEPGRGRPDRTDRPDRTGPTGRFFHDHERPLGHDLLVVDEVSMLDLALAHHLLKALQPPTRLILVGDPDQLPSVAAGNVLADLLASGVVPAVRLTEIFRQERGSLIVENAHRILAGRTPDLAGGPDADFFFFPAEPDARAAERLVEVVTERIPRRFGLEWIDDVQVLAPMYRGPCGVDALNQLLRERFGSGGHELFDTRGDARRVWRTGDRVIHTRNDYEKEVFNGDLGRIARVEPDGSGLHVRYPEREVFYDRPSLSDLQPAFAITVHRSQGGEFPAVVLPLVPSHALMLQRHLLYTAVTRARRLLVLVGSRRALSMAVKNAAPRERESGLADRLAREMEQRNRKRGAP